jgi:tRNA dimethylallyltransferase
LKPRHNKTVIIIAGPTAVGKSAAAIELAKHFNAEIISADSRQCYKELNIGVARPSLQELQEVPHHFIASHSIQEEVTAITFEQYALEKTAQLFQHHPIVVMVGGTGLYIKAFCEGLDAIPPILPSIRTNIIKQYEVNGLAWLQQIVQEKDPSYFSTGEIQNPQRLMRALEVIESTGHSITTYQKKEKATRDFNIVKIGLELPREVLVQRIHQRVDKMMEDGQLEEVKSLLPYQHLNALQTVGYAELFEYLKGQSSLPKAIENIKTHTRQYAKRQMTWFKRDEEIKWFAPTAIEAMLNYLESK